eukprot:gene20426-24510_t
MDTSIQQSNPQGQQVSGYRQQPRSNELSRMSDWDPMRSFFNDPFFTPMNRLSRMFNDLEKQFYNDIVPSGSGGGGGLTSAFRTPRTLVDEQNDAYIVKCEMPGLDKSDVKVSFNRGNLTIESKKETQQEEGGSRQQFYQSFYKSVAFPENVKEEDINAKMENGILEINLPKSTADKEHHINVV